MPEFRARSRSQSVSIPSTANLSLKAFAGRGHSLLPPPKSDRVLFPGIQTSTNGTSNTSSSHWKAHLTNPFRSSRTTSMVGPAPRATEVLQPQVAPRQRTIVRKSLRIPEVNRAALMKTSVPVKAKPEEVDSDDEGTLVSLSGPEVPAPNNVVTEKKLVVEERRPAAVKQSSRVSRKILTVIPDMYDNMKDEDRSSMQEPQERVLRTRKSQHWGLRSSLYQPEFVIEKESEKEVDAAFTSLSPPPNFHRRPNSFSPRRL